MWEMREGVEGYGWMETLRIKYLGLGEDELEVYVRFGDFGKIRGWREGYGFLLVEEECWEILCVFSVGLYVLFFNFYSGVLDLFYR